jgi:hypothetical protein
MDKVEKFTKVLERAFSADMAKLASHDFKKYQQLFKEEYETAIKIVIAIKDAKLLAELMKTYHTLYERYAKNKDNINFYRSDQLFQILYEQSGKVTDPALFETWDGYLGPNSAAPSFRTRYAALNPTTQRDIDNFRKLEREKRRNKRSILDLLRDEYARRNGHNSTNDELYNFDPRPGITRVVEEQITAITKIWNVVRRDYTKDSAEIFDGALAAFNKYLRAQAKEDLLSLFQTIKHLQGMFKDKRETRTKPKTGQTETYRTWGDPHEVVLFHGLYAIACTQLIRVAQADKLFTRNRNGLTAEEMAYFYHPVERDDFFYRSNIRQVLAPPFNQDIAFGEIKAFLGTYALTKAKLTGLDLVHLDKTLEIQEKWREVEVVTDLIQLASKNNDIARLKEIFADPRSEKGIAYLKEISSTQIKTKNPQELGKGTLAAGSRAGSHDRFGDITVVYIDPKNPNQIYVELSTLRPQLFLAHQNYIDDKFYADKIMEIYQSTVGVVYITEIIFMAMGFLPVLIEAGFAGLIYEIAVFYASSKIEEQASKINPTFGKVLGLLIQTFAPRPNFKPKITTGVTERTDRTALNEVLTRPTDKPFLDRATGKSQRVGGSFTAPPKPLQGPPEHFPFAEGKPLPKPEQPDTVYRIMSNDEAAKTVANQELSPPIRGAEGERFVSLDSNYTALFREKELADLERKFAGQLSKAEQAEWNIRKRMAEFKASGKADDAAKMQARLEKLEAEQKQRGIANKAEADAVIKKWHAMEGQQVVVEIQLVPGTLDEILRRSVDVSKWGQYSRSNKDVFLWKLERGYGRNIGIPKWQLDAFNERIAKVRLHAHKQPLGKAGLAKASDFGPN